MTDFKIRRDMYNEAVAVVRKDKKASTSYLQRTMKISYNYAAVLIGKLEEAGVVSKPDRQGQRVVN